MADLVQYYGTGRRKSSIARVFLRPGSGKFSVNKKDVDVYFVTAQQRASAKRSLGIENIGETFDVITTVRGGGVHGSNRMRVKLGIARALMQFNPELTKGAQERSLVTRSSRAKHAKYGQKGRSRTLPVLEAIKAFQQQISTPLTRTQHFSRANCRLTTTP